MKIPKHYSMMKEHPGSYEVHDSRDGKSFHVAKAPLDLEGHAKMKALPHFDQGGAVGSDLGADQSQSIVTTDPAAQGGGAPASVGATADWGAPIAPAPAAAQPNFAAVNQGIAGGLMANERLGEKAATQIGQEKATQYGQESDAYQRAQRATSDFVAATQASQQLHNEELDKLAQQASVKIDPNQYMNNMSTGNKVLAAIAMAIGGAGSGITGGPNLAYQTIQEAIRRDVESQKENASSARSLYSENLRRYGDQRLADQATMMQMNAATQGQIAAIAAKGAAAQAGPQAQLLIKQMRDDNLMKSMQFAMRDLALKHLDNPNIDPSVLVPALVPEAHQKDVFTSIDQAKAASGSEQNLLNLYDKAASETRPMTGGLSGVLNTIPGYHPPAVRGLIAGVDPLIHDNEGRINEAEQNDLRGILPKFGDSDATVASNRQQFQEFINHKKAGSVAKGYGIDTSRYNVTRGHAGQAPAGAPQEGMTASNPTTGQRVIMRGGQWTPVNAQ